MENIDSENVSINTATVGRYSIPSYMNNPKRSEATPLQGANSDNRGLHLIATCLSALTLLVSLALAAQMYYGDNKLAVHGSIATDSDDCTEIGAAVLDRGGSAVDAAVAATICMTLVHPHLTSIGGGGLMIVWDQREGRAADCLDFSVGRRSGNASGVGVPGLLAGLYAAHAAHGKINWTELIQPTVQLARNGFRTAKSLSDSYEWLKSGGGRVSADVSNWLSGVTADGVMKSARLADTLETVANSGADAFYNGSLAEQLAGPLGGAEHLNGYRVARGGCTEKVIAGYKLVTTGRGSGGPLFNRLMSKLNLTNSLNDSTLATLFALQGDEESDRRYSAGVGVLTMDDADMYATVVSGLGSVFGSQVMTAGGYLLNDGVDTSVASAGADDDRADSLMLPLVAVDDGKICGRRLITGGSDARDVIQLVSRLMAGGDGADEVQNGVEAPRARLSSAGVRLERLHAPSVCADCLLRIEADGFSLADAAYPYPSLNVAQKKADVMDAYSDSRGRGRAITF